MNLLLNPLLSSPWLLLPQLGFTIWMAVDASRRSTGSNWIYIILFFQPLGAWIYFFTVKVNDFAGGHGPAPLTGLGWLTAPSDWNPFNRRESLDELRYRAEQVPTVASQLALADRLIERREYEEALPHARRVLTFEPDHGAGLYAVAVCQRALGKPAEAQATLEPLLKRDPRWSDYTAWKLSITVRAESGDGAGALESARGLAKQSPTLEHQCVLAERLIAEGAGEEARGVLESALRTHTYSPPYLRRRDARWARQARRLRSQAG